jgi:hypothetical protein
MMIGEFAIATVASYEFKSQLIEKALPGLLRLSFSVQARLLDLCLNLLSCPAFSLPGAVLHKVWTVDSKGVAAVT